MSRGNKGEWSELYAFIKLLKEGRIFAADENANRIDNIYLPIIKIIREDNPNQVIDYYTGDIVRICEGGILLEEIPVDKLQQPSERLFKRIFEGALDPERTHVFAIDEIAPFMERMHIKKVKVPSTDKIDMKLQIHDIHTGYEPDVGFSVKSDMGSPPTLLNSGKNTRIQYKVSGLKEKQVDEINSIDKSITRNYMVSRISRLFELAADVEFRKVKNPSFEGNLMMIDSLMPKIYGEMVLKHYRDIESGIYDCDALVDYLISANPMNYRDSQIYAYKFKKLLCASALGMTPGARWDGRDNISGGYIIIKRDGDVLCYHLFNRNFFEDYLFKNTRFDRPSASRYDYAYVYNSDGNDYIDLNVQIRFTSIR